MEHAHLRYFLVVGASVSFVLMCVSAMLLSQAQKHAERRDKRLASIGDAHQRIITLEISAIGERTAVEKR